MVRRSGETFSEHKLDTGDQFLPAKSVGAAQEMKQLARNPHDAAWYPLPPLILSLIGLNVFALRD